jgi:hypothetical protein
MVTKITNITKITKITKMIALGSADRPKGQMAASAYLMSTTDWSSGLSWHLHYLIASGFDPVYKIICQFFT